MSDDVFDRGASDELESESFVFRIAASSSQNAGSCAALPFVGVSIYLLWVGITQSGATVRKRKARSLLTAR